MELVVYVLVAWVMASFVVSFGRHYKDVAHEREEQNSIKLLLLQIVVEQYNGLWYGWHIDDEDSESFVAQGSSYEEAILNCKKRVEEKNPEYKIIFKFMVKRDEQPALQN